MTKIRRKTTTTSFFAKRRKRRSRQLSAPTFLVVLLVTVFLGMVLQSMLPNNRRLLRGDDFDTNDDDAASPSFQLLQRQQQERLRKAGTTTTSNANRGSATSSAQPQSQTTGSTSPSFTKSSLQNNNNIENQNNNHQNNNKHNNNHNNKHNHNHNHNNNHKNNAVLIIGGSDGSGTRAFVNVAGALHVPMLVDDAQTLDIHAPCFAAGQGWPAVAQQVLGVTHSLDYQVGDVISDNQNDLSHEFQTCFREHYASRAGRLLQTYQTETNDLAGHVRYGWKAPISMALLPFLQTVYEEIYFLHVIRDGRDVALSTNTSPVDKFYQVFYEPARRIHNNDNNNDDTMIQHIQAMQLWNDWNTQVYEWATEKTTEKTSSSSAFHYLPVRTEDLLTRRQDVLQQVAAFVGSPKTDRDLCQLSRHELHDMGQSVAHNNNNNNHNNDDNAPPRRRPNILDQLPNVAAHEQPSTTTTTTTRPSSPLDDLKAWKDAHAGLSQRLRQDEEAPILEDTDYQQYLLKQHRQDLLHHIQNPEARRKFRELQQDVDAQLLQQQPQQPQQAAVTHRYGKWKALEQTHPALLARLEQVGARGLALFGYTSHHDQHAVFGPVLSEPVVPAACPESDDSADDAVRSL